MYVPRNYTHVATSLDLTEDVARQPWEAPPTARPKTATCLSAAIVPPVAPEPPRSAAQIVDQLSVGSSRASTVSAPASKNAFVCKLSSLDEIAREILRGELDGTPRRKTAAFAGMEASGRVGDLTDVVYPSLAPKPVSSPTSTSLLSGILGPDVAVVAAEDHPNVVVMLPCHTWDHALNDPYAPESRLSDAVCVAIDDVPSTDDIRVFGEASTRVPFVVKCSCGKSPCGVELPWDWASAGCSLDAPGLADTLKDPQSSLLYSSRFGHDAEVGARTRFLASSPARVPDGGHIHLDMKAQGLEEDDVLAATHMLSACGHGVGTLMHVATRRQQAVATQGDSRRFTQTLTGTVRPQSPLFSACVNESRQALKGRVRVFRGLHRVYGPGEAEHAHLDATFPHPDGCSFKGVVELYQASGVVMEVATVSNMNTIAVSRSLARLPGEPKGSPSKHDVTSRLARKPAIPRPAGALSSSGRSIISTHSEAPPSARSTVSSTSSRASSARSGWAQPSAQPGARNRGPTSSLRAMPDPEAVFQPATPRPFVRMELTAVGSCDIDTGEGWAMYTAHDAQGKVLWQLQAAGKSRAPFDPVCIPNPELVVPILRSLDAHEPFGQMFMQLCHALFPGATDAMWHYLRRLQDWDAVHDTLCVAAERMRLRITITAPTTEDVFADEAIQLLTSDV